MRKFLTLLNAGIILMFVGAACTATPIPEPQTLDWHLAFSSDSQSSLIRCRIIGDSDDTVQDLFTPITVQLQATLLTQQIIEESILILEQGNPSLATLLSTRYKDKSYFYLLIKPEIISETNILQPFEMSPILFPGEFYALNEIEFYLPNDESFTLVSGYTELPIADGFKFPTVLAPNKSYLIPIAQNNLTLQEMSSKGFLELKVDLLAQPPFANRFCNETSDSTFHLRLPIAEGKARIMPTAYGEMSTQFNQENDRASLRVELLSELLPLAFIDDYKPPTSTPSPTTIATAVSLTRTPRP